MPPKITPPLGYQTVEKFWNCNDLNLAAAVLSDSRSPRLGQHTVSEIVDGETAYYRFKLEYSPRSSKIRSLWNMLAAGQSVDSTDPAAFVWNAFQFHARFVQLIKQGVRLRRPPIDPMGVFWTTNSHIPAAALALAGLPPITDDRLRAMIYLDHASQSPIPSGFYLASAALLNAFANPVEFISTHPEDPLAYVVAAFHIRERLYDIVKQLPGRKYTFRDTETGHVHFIAEPDETRN